MVLSYKMIKVKSDSWPDKAATTGMESIKNSSKGEFFLFWQNDAVQSSTVSLLYEARAIPVATGFEVINFDPVNVQPTSV